MNIGVGVGIILRRRHLAHQNAPEAAQSWRIKGLTPCRRPTSAPSIVSHSKTKTHRHTALGKLDQIVESFFSLTAITLSFPSCFPNIDRNDIAGIMLLTTLSTALLSAASLVSAQVQQSIVNPTTAASTATPLPSASNYAYVGCWNETTQVANTGGVRALSNGNSVSQSNSLRLTSTH